ncbi:MAG: S8 family serine peptidase [Chitinophagaceae bacterium]|nr:S8 family serine peptidase [Chitinophagaceae bacterium]
MLKRILPVLILTCMVNGLVRAQLTTNKEALENTAISLRQAGQTNYAKALSLARQKNWPLTIRTREGALGVLVGVDQFNFPKYYITNSNIIAAATTRANQLWPGGVSGLGLSGSSANLKNKIGIWDGGRILENHVELTGRITQKDNPSSVDGHATHVAGTMIATGINPSAKGMAYGAQGMVAYDFNNDNAEIAAEAINLLISNHSYSTISGWNFNSTQNRWEFYGRPGENEDYKFGYYSSDAQVLDSIAYNAPFYLMVKSAGNNRGSKGPAEGQPYYRYNSSNQMISAGNRPAGISSNDSYGTIPWDGNAKNILTVGAISGIPAGYSRPEDAVMSSFSSWGPTDDGRIKPDIVADGVEVLSSYSTSTSSYTVQSGTSMSSPNAAGSLFLLQELYSKLKSGAFLRSASIKGIAIHTADEAGSFSGPDYRFGWGLLNVQKGAAVISAFAADNNSATSPHLLYENVFSGTTTSFTTNVIASGNGPLRATISWTDVKGNVETVDVLNNPAKKLINDLDLRITTNGGATTFQPWVLDPAAPANAATTGDNITDNVERVDIENPVPGQTYTIRVNYKGTLTRGQQAYTLLVSGVGGVGYCASGATDNTGSRIDSVTFQTLRYANPAGGTTYTNKTDLLADIEPTQSVAYRVLVNSADASNADKIAKMYIDYNNNGSFSDAGELVATSGVLKNTQVFSGSFTTPGTLTIGNTFRVRIVLRETSTASDVDPCNTYAKGETFDFKVRVVNPSTDVAITDITTPSVSDCADNTQYLTVTIRNNGSAAKTNIPITADIKNGATTVATITGTYPGTISAAATAQFTLQTAFPTTAGVTYTVAATANMPGDQNSSNNTLTTAITISQKTAAPTAIAGICDNNTALLRVSNPNIGSNYFWYNGATATLPFTSGSTANTTNIPGDRKFYLATEYKGSIGPATKMAYTDGGYNNFRGNFVRFNNSVPIILESARLYIGNPGTIQIIVATLGTVNQDGSFTYFPEASTTLTVTATNPNPAPGAVTGNPATDTGAVYYLNLPVTQTGDHILLVICNENGATIFRNNNISGTTYPMSIPGVMSITGNSVNLTDATANVNPFYYFFYNLKVRTTAGCPSDKVEVLANTIPTPVVTQVGDSLVSSIATGNQWFLNDVGISGATGQKFKPTQSGTYKTIVTDVLGCQKTSNAMPVVITALAPEVVAQEIKLSVSPNPNKGLFNLSFEVKTKADLTIDMITESGQRIYSSSYPGFNGKFSKEIRLGTLASGYYVLKIQHNKKTYVQKVLVVK